MLTHSYIRTIVPQDVPIAKYNHFWLPQKEGDEFPVCLGNCKVFELQLDWMRLLLCSLCRSLYCIRIALVLSLMIQDTFSSATLDPASIG